MCTRTPCVALGCGQCAAEGARCAVCKDPTTGATTCKPWDERAHPCDANERPTANAGSPPDPSVCSVQPNDAGSDGSTLDGSMPDGSAADGGDAGGCGPNIVVAEVFPWGGAQFASDFVVLHNRSAGAVSLTGTSVQLQDGFSTGAWTVVALTGTLDAGKYYFVQLATTAGTFPPLPTPNATGTYDLPSAGGRVAFVSTTTPLSGAFPAGYVDLVGYGATQQAETNAVSGLISGNSAQRKLVACRDTNDNNADFAVAFPMPKNAASSGNACSCP